MDLTASSGGLQTIDVIELLLLAGTMCFVRCFCAFQAPATPFEKCLENLRMFQGGHHNPDHPEAFRFSLLVSSVESGKGVKTQISNYMVGARTAKFMRIYSCLCFLWQLICHIGRREYFNYD
jgi:hypothetical protein